MTNEHMTSDSVSRGIRGIQNTTPVKYHFTPVRWVTRRKVGIAERTLKYCWQQGKWVPPLWKTTGQHPDTSKMHGSQWPLDWGSGINLQNFLLIAAVFNLVKTPNSLSAPQRENAGTDPGALSAILYCRESK